MNAAPLRQISPKISPNRVQIDQLSEIFSLLSLLKQHNSSQSRELETAKLGRLIEISPGAWQWDVWRAALELISSTHSIETVKGPLVSTSLLVESASDESHYEAT